MILLQNRILVKISEETREQQFDTWHTLANGEKLLLATEIPEYDKNQSRAYEQSVCLGEVLAVAWDVEDIKVGDLVMLDYMVDMSPELVVYQDKTHKKVSITAKNTYYDKDFMIPASRRTKRQCYAYRKGDMESLSPVLGIVRGDVIIPHEFLVLAEFKDDSQALKIAYGDILMKDDKPVVERKVVAASPTSPVLAGQNVMVFGQFVFPFVYGQYKYDMFYEHDVLLSF